jgi:hypothetical protein
LKKLDLYNLALSLLDIELDDLVTDSKGLRILNLNYSKVVSFCLKAWDFPFLIKQEKLMEYDLDANGNPIGWNNFMFGYTVPSGFGRALQLNASKNLSYSYRFGKLWCNVAYPSLEYMPSTIEVDEEGNYLAPDDFMSLVAYQLALHIAPSLDPESQATSIAAQLYQLTLSSIMESEIRNNDRPENFESSSLWVDGEVFSQEDLRTAIVQGTL